MIPIIDLIIKKKNTHTHTFYSRPSALPIHSYGLHKSSEYYIMSNHYALFIDYK